MKIERIKKSHKKQVVIGVLAVCVVGGALTFNLTRAKYKLTESIPLVRGTVNYKVPDLRTVALYTANGSGDYVETNNIPTSGYGLNKTKSVCKVYDGSTSVENAPVDSSITIEYTNGKVNFLGISKRNTRCYLYFDKKNYKDISDIIAASKKGSGTPAFSKTSCTSGCDEVTVGTYTVSDGMYGGTSTYFRGDTTDNYVMFAGFCWRIVRINGDGSIRLIYDGSTCHANGTSTTDSIAVASQAYNKIATQSNYVGWTYSGTSQRTLSGTSSNAKSQIESWYNTNLASYATKIADGKYCNDRNVDNPPSSFGWSSGSYTTTWNVTGTTFAYAGIKRLHESYQPTLSCGSGDVYTLKVGLITADEVEFAGGKNANNKLYYLYNGQKYWTMTPSFWNSSGFANMLYIISNGQVSYNVITSECGLRPVINLKPDVTFTIESNGTETNPYIVK